MAKREIKCAVKRSGKQFIFILVHL